MANFAVIGVGGYIAPWHLDAIKECGHKLVTSYDSKDSVGIMDRYFPDCQFFTEFERFATFVDKAKGTKDQVDWISICTPNYLHADHIRFALRNGANAICEKPLVLHTKDIDDLVKVEKETGKKAYTVLQLRVHDAVKAMKEKVQRENKDLYNIELEYMTSRGQWYHASWKGDERKSGGLSTNIGVHFFDMLTWIFGSVKEIRMEKRGPSLEKGFVRLEKAKVNWLLTIDRKNLPAEAAMAGKTTYRSIKIDGEDFEFSEGFTELHKIVYKDILSGGGYGISDARPAIEIVEKIREMESQK